MLKSYQMSYVLGPAHSPRISLMTERLNEPSLGQHYLQRRWWPRPKTEPKFIMAIDLTKLPEGQDRWVPTPCLTFPIHDLQPVLNTFPNHIIRAERREGTQFNGKPGVPRAPRCSLRALGCPPLSQSSYSLSLVSLGPGCDFYLPSLNSYVLRPAFFSGLGTQVCISVV